MKLLTVLVTALTLLGLGGAAMACDGLDKRGNASAESRYIPPGDKTS